MITMLNRFFRNLQASDVRERLMQSLLALLALSIINALIYREYWTGDRIFTGSDLLTAFGPLLNFQTDCLQSHSWPFWNPFMNFGYPFIEHYSNTVFFPTHFLMGMITGSSMYIIQCEILLWIVIGGFGVYLCVREAGSSSLAGIVAGACYMFCGQMIALPQWHLLVYNAACFPFYVLGYLRAKKADTPLNFISIAFLTMAIFGGHITTTVLSIYVFALFVLMDAVLIRRFRFALTFLAVTMTASALLALPKLGPLYQALHLGPRMNAPEVFKNGHDVINFYNFLSFILPVKYYFSLYIGELGILALLYAALRKTLKIDALLLAFLATAWLLFVDAEGNLSLLRTVVNVLPLMRLVRNEWFEWFFPLFFAILYLAKYIDALLSDERNRQHALALIVFLVLLTVSFLTAFDTTIHLNAYVAHVMLAVVWLSLTFIRDNKRTQLLLALVLITAEFFLVFNRVSIDDAPVRSNDRIAFATTDQTNASRSYTDGNLVRNKMPKIVLQDDVRPSIDDSRQWPVLSSGADGNFIDSMNQKRFTGWWFNAQERYDFIRIKESPLLEALDGKPLYALFSTSGGLQPTAPILFEGITCSSFSFRVGVPEAGFFILNQMFDKRWSVRVDGRPVPLLLANDFFMGLDLVPGEHRVTFQFRDRIFTASVIISVVTLAGLIGWRFVRMRRGKPDLQTTFH